MLKVILLEAFEDDIDRPLCNFSLHYVIFEMLSDVQNGYVRDVLCYG